MQLVPAYRLLCSLLAQPLRIFPNEISCLRLVTALAVEQSEEWITGRRYLDMGELEGQCPEEERDVEGVIARGTMR